MQYFKSIFPQHW